MLFQVPNEKSTNPQVTLHPPPKQQLSISNYGPLIRTISVLTEFGGWGLFLWLLNQKYGIKTIRDVFNSVHIFIA